MLYRPVIFTLLALVARNLLTLALARLGPAALNNINLTAHSIRRRSGVSPTKLPAETEIEKSGRRGNQRQSHDGM
ncbi:hypothetical protein B0T18DRAFT_420680 [Schizothecium vesticola]|uniref:Secreted protein n=1 Tax=Schizothecium vesticola TaxID=314040 RepID=A0AA40BPG4_9PEZI|nr:hypothetical protein B0T18DRAFT_420680 [Schizothecium vesticola]